MVYPRVYSTDLDGLRLIVSFGEVIPFAGHFDYIEKHRSQI